MRESLVAVGDGDDEEEGNRKIRKKKE